MIRTKEDLKFYLAADKAALKIDRRRPALFGDRVWRYQRALRHVEYYKNSSRGILRRLLYLAWRLRHESLAVKTGFSIQPNCFGPGLSIAHEGTIVVNGNARIGANCRLHVCVNIGASNGSPKAPRIGDNVYIAPGAKIFGDIEIADDVAIGANAVVNKSFAEKGITIGGIPAKKISDRDSEGLVVKGTQLTAVGQ
jgi:serine O-acetyltransferase